MKMHPCALVTLDLEEKTYQLNYPKEILDRIELIREPNHCEFCKQVNDFIENQDDEDAV